MPFRKIILEILGTINQKGEKIKRKESNRKLYPKFSQEGQRIPAEAVSFVVVQCCNEPRGPPEGGGSRGGGSARKG